MLVEAAVENAREIECGVLERLDGHRPDTSPVAEIVVGFVSNRHERLGFEDFMFRLDRVVNVAMAMLS